jgi:tRNA (cmo5U34)-methyltransferase
MGNALNRFNWIASLYDKLAKLFFGSELLKAQLHFIQEIKAGDHLLIIGGGSGEFLLLLLKAHPDIKVTYVEASSRMISLSREKVKAFSNVEFIHGTEDEISNMSYDFIIANFFFDVFNQPVLDQIIEKLGRNLKSRGKWIVTDFTGSRLPYHRFLLKAMYMFFKSRGSIDASKLPQWLVTLQRHGLKLKHERLFVNGFVSSQIFEKEHSVY